MAQFHFLGHSIDGLGGLKSEDISVLMFLNRFEMVILHIHVSETEIEREMYSFAYLTNV